MDVENAIAELLPNPLEPFGFLDVLPFYSLASFFMSGFLGEREVASRIWLAGGQRLVKRATRLGKLTARQLSSMFDRGFFMKRKGHLADAGVSGEMELAWRYFPPRKLCDYFYATNHEGRGKPIRRIFFDIDRGEGMDAETARKVALAVRERMDEALSSLRIPHRMFQTWTGKSFHVYALLERDVDHGFYDAYLSPSGEFSAWAGEISRELGIDVVWGHEKGSGRIVIDPSQTPSGKLDRAPFSLHMKYRNGKAEVDGVSVPISESMLREDGIASTLSSLSPKDVVSEIRKWASLLPAEDI